MAESLDPVTIPVDASAGHLSVHVAGGSGGEYAPFSFEWQPRRLSVSVVTAVALDVAAIALLIFISRWPSPAASAAVVVPDPPNVNIIWLSQPGPGGGGGGGGNRMKEPARQAERPGRDRITIPAAKPLTLEPPRQVRNNLSVLQRLDIPAKSLASAQDQLPGAIDAPPGPPSFSQGPGSGGGAGTGTGTGIGSGRGSGLGPGSGGGTGGGVYRPGNGVTPPVAVFVPKPQYTSDAMRARIQGSVWIECVVQTNGLCSEIQVTRSLDPSFGLDDEAVKAARQFRFRPGMLRGEPVQVLVSIELSFTLR